VVWAGSGDARPYNPGYDFAEGVHKVAILRWDTSTLGWVKWQGASTAPDVAIANFPAVTTVSGTVTTTAPEITTVTYVFAPTFFLATTSIVSGSIRVASGNVGVSGFVVASLSGISYIFASQSSGANYGISGNVGATQSGIWTMGITPGSQIAIASGSVGLTGTNYVIASATQVASYTYADVSAAGNTQAIPAQGGLIRIVVNQCSLVASPSVMVCFLSSTSTVSSRKPVGGGTGFGGGFVLPYSPHGWFRSRPGEALNIQLGAASTVGCDLVWSTVNG